MRKAKAEIGVNIDERVEPRSAILVPVRTERVLTTASFAEKPVIREVEILQSLKPRGANTGAMNLPIKARRESALFSTTLR